MENPVEQLSYAAEPLEIKTSRCLTVAVMGAGSRGNEYTAYGKLFPGTLKVVAVADINLGRRNHMGDAWDIPAELRFGDFRELLAAGGGHGVTALPSLKGSSESGVEDSPALGVVGRSLRDRRALADILIISLPDDLHYEAAMAAMLQGYDLLLEKPMARSAQECRDLLKRQQETGVFVAVGHVLRYSPYFRAMKRALDEGLIGELVNVQHQEPVLFAHMAHSFVRGNWHNSKASTPMILAKSCHDMDILRWMIGKHCERVSAEGELTLFRADRAPKGAPERCSRDCPHEATCPYSAYDIYVRRRWFLYVFDLDRQTATDEEIWRHVSGSYYGQCVYHCDNDQPDHIVTALRFEGGVTASFTMDAFTPWGGRRTRLMGTTGYLEGDGTTFTVYDFRTGKKLGWHFEEPEGKYKASGHAGGDLALIRDLVRAVDTRDARYLSSDLATSVESHLMAFACEKSRLDGTVEAVR